MRSSRLSVAAVALVLALGCGDGGNGPANQAPTANFDLPVCAQVSCTFTDASTDADGTIASRAWTFENGTPATSTTATQAVDFSAAGTHTVTLTVTDNDGDSDDFSRDVTVTGAPGNQAPVADFTFTCSSLDCTFTDASSDADGTIATYAWTFTGGTAGTSAEPSPAHSYDVAALTQVSATLTVTDDDGATDSKTENFTVAPPATLTCGGSACTLLLESAATVRATLISSECTAAGNDFLITAPASIAGTIFADGCSLPDGTFVDLNGGAQLGAGTALEAEVISGSTDPGRIAPAIEVTGTFATGWTLKFDDGEDPTGPGEPDFNDLVIQITATP